MSTPQNEPTQADILEAALEAKLHKLEPSESSVVICRLEMDPADPLELRHQRIQGVQRALGHALAEAGISAPFLVTDETVAIQLEESHHQLLRDLWAYFRKLPADRKPEEPGQLWDRLRAVFDPEAVVDTSGPITTGEAPHQGGTETGPEGHLAPDAE